MTPTGSEPDAATICTDNNLRQSAVSSAAKSGAVQPDPDLARIIDVWFDLPAHIRAAVLALVQAGR